MKHTVNGQKWRLGVDNFIHPNVLMVLEEELYLCLMVGVKYGRASFKRILWMGSEDTCTAMETIVLDFGKWENSMGTLRESMSQQRSTKASGRMPIDTVENFLTKPLSHSTIQSHIFKQKKLIWICM